MKSLKTYFCMERVDFFFGRHNCFFSEMLKHPKVRQVKAEINSIFFSLFILLANLKTHSQYYSRLIIGVFPEWIGRGGRGLYVVNSYVQTCICRFFIPPSSSSPPLSGVGRWFYKSSLDMFGHIIYAYTASNPHTHISLDFSFKLLTPKTNLQLFAINFAKYRRFSGMDGAARFTRHRRKEDRVKRPLVWRWVVEGGAKVETVARRISGDARPTVYAEPERREKVLLRPRPPAVIASKPQRLCTYILVFFILRRSLNQNEERICWTSDATRVFLSVFYSRRFYGAKRLIHCFYFRFLCVFSEYHLSCMEFDENGIPWRSRVFPRVNSEKPIVVF